MALVAGLTQSKRDCVTTSIVRIVHIIRNLKNSLVTLLVAYIVVSYMVKKKVCITILYIIIIIYISFSLFSHHHKDQKVEILA